MCGAVWGALDLDDEVTAGKNRRQWTTFGHIRKLVSCYPDSNQAISYFHSRVPAQLTTVYWDEEIKTEWHEAPRARQDPVKLAGGPYRLAGVLYVNGYACITMVIAFFSPGSEAIKLSAPMSGNVALLDSSVSW